MNRKAIAALVFSAAACLCFTACGPKIEIGNVSKNSSKVDNKKTDDKSDGFFADILDKGYTADDEGEKYTIDGDFAMKDLYELDEMYADGWAASSDEQKREISLNFLNFWAFYGDDASIRFKPNELVDAITSAIEDTELSVLDAALQTAVPEKVDTYLAIIGIEEIPEITEDSSETEEISETDSETSQPEVADVTDTDESSETSEPETSAENI